MSVIDYYVIIAFCIIGIIVFGIPVFKHYLPSTKGEDEKPTASTG